MITPESRSPVSTPSRRPSGPVAYLAALAPPFLDPTRRPAASSTTPRPLRRPYPAPLRRPAASRRPTALTPPFPAASVPTCGPPPLPAAPPPSPAVPAALTCGPRRPQLRPRRPYLRPRRPHLRSPPHLPAVPAALTCGLADPTCGPAALTCGPCRPHQRPRHPHLRPCRPSFRPRHLLQRHPPPEPPHLAEQPIAAPPGSRAAEPPNSRATEPPCSRAAQQPSRPAAEPPSRPAAEQPSRPAAEPPSRPTSEPSEQPRLSTDVMATPSVLAFDAEGRAIDFDVWVDDLQLFLQCDRADGLSLFDLTSGASLAPAADADATVRSQWATRNAAARLAVRRHLPTSERAHFSQYKSAQTLYDAVVARYSSLATAALSRLLLPYLFPDLAAFSTVADLITHLRTSNTRYRAALPADFCAKNPPPILGVLRLGVLFLGVLCLGVLSLGVLSLGVAEPGGAEPWGAEPGGALPGGATPWCVAPGGDELRGAPPGGSPGASSLREPLSPQELREWFARRWRRAAGAGGSSDTEGAAVAGPGGARTVSTGAAGPASSTGAGAAEGVGTETTAGGPAGGTPGAAGGSGAAGGAAGEGAPTGGAGAVPAVSGVAARPRPYFVPLLEQVLGSPPSAGLPPALACPQPVTSQLQLQPTSPLPAPSPYTAPTGGLAERREPASRPALPVRAAHASGRGSRQRPPPVPGMHRMSLRPSTAPLRAPLHSPPASSLPAIADLESDSLRAPSPTVPRLLATVVTDPSFESSAASALVAELVDFAARCRLDYAASLVAESESVCPLSVGGECALGTDVLEDTQEDFLCLAAASPHLVSVLLTPEGDPDALDIPTLRSYAEAIEGPYSSQWQAAMDAEMASWKSTRTYVDAVPPPGANIVSGMWIFRVKRPPGSPHVFKAHYVARGFSQRQGVDYFQTFSPTPKMTTLRILLHVAAHRDYELHSLDFSTAFLQGSLHEEIWLRRPLGFTGTFPPGTQWSLRRSVYGLRQAPREWHDTLRTTLAALGFAPFTADPSLFLCTDTSLPPFYILVYVDDLVFATADTAGLAHVKSELQKRHTCTDLGELCSYLGLQITRDRARRTITLTQSHMVQQVLQRFGFTYSSPQATPLSTRHSLSALPSDESVESSGPYPELVGCLMYLMTCTRPHLAYPLSILARYVAPGRHRPEHMAAAKRVLRYLCSTSGMGLVLGGRSPVVLTGHADASWADD
ncbi:unnamed protein product [Closterium sp. NIES-54]